MVCSCETGGVGALVLDYLIVPGLLRSADLNMTGLPPLSGIDFLYVSVYDCSQIVTLERAIMPVVLLRELLVRGF